MKKHSEKYWLATMIVLLVVFLVALYGNIRGQENTSYSLSGILEMEINDSVVIAPQRSNIVFILGEDKDGENPYYTEALRYYQFQNEQRAGQLVTHCRSLEAVRDFLAKHRKNDLPWGTVQLVMHANEFNGLGVALFDGGKRATVGALEAAVSNNIFSELPDEVLDANSEMVLLGCGLGRNQEAVDAVKAAFGGSGESPVVSATKYFVLYSSETHNGHTYAARQYEADYWYAFYKTGYRPGDIRLSRQLNRRNPDAQVNWRDALTRTAPRSESDSWHYTFKIPVVWWETYEDKADRPELKNEADQETWLRSQEPLQKLFEEYGIPAEQFQWTFRKTDYEFEDGTRVPAVKAIGLCTVLCVLRPTLSSKKTKKPPTTTSPTTTSN